MECKHLDAVVRGFDLMGKAWCPTCQQHVQLSKVINNFLDALREALKNANR